ncbi:hypothetical protein GF420_04395 [candidate division GN15 bacterium]|nr:hypothetical protein [candidate division GN15 bacterium]
MKKVLILLASAAILLTLACSDDKKEEAARLEQEMLGEDQRPDTVSPDTAPPTTTEPETAGEPEAVPEEEAKPVGLPSQPMGSGYAVQVASCPSSEYAEHLVGLYQKRGYEPWVTTYTADDGSIYFRVRLGLFDSASEAGKMKQELHDKYSIDPWVDEIL